jgi:beta-aspartyl-peptidase (threonine type)
VTTIRNLIRAAHAMMMQCPHVMLMGQGADTFAAEKGLEIVDPSYFYTSFDGISCKKRLPRNGCCRTMT